MSMVDISEKPVVFRKARAEARLVMPPELLSGVSGGDLESPKGPVFQTAIVAGTLAAKKTSDLIPYCHPIPVERCNVEVKAEADGEVVVRVDVATHARTGIEMEALVAVTAAALTVYDMCKGMTTSPIVIREVRLVEKAKENA